MKKQGLWFLTLFSLILVLSVYYITMPNELFKTNNSKQEETEEVSKEVKEVTAVAALKVELKEERREKVEELNQTINSDSSSTEEKNKAYEELKEIRQQAKEYAANTTAQIKILKRRMKKEK